MARRRWRRRTRGGALIGLVIMVVVVFVSALVLVRALNDAARLRAVTDEMASADEEARRILERMHSLPFNEIFRRYNGTEADNPATGPSPGGKFSVRGISARSSDGDGLPGDIFFPTNHGVPGILCETASGFPGAPVDLNADGDAADADVTATHRVLPVRIRVQWGGLAGDGVIEVSTVFTEMP